jgi:hypothetical protein
MVLAKVNVDDLTVEKLSQSTYRILKGESQLVSIIELPNKKYEVIVFKVNEVFRVEVC